MDRQSIDNMHINDLKALFLFLGKAIVDRTDNKLDDKFYEIIAKMIKEEKSIFDLFLDIFWG